MRAGLILSITLAFASLALAESFTANVASSRAAAILEPRPEEVIDRLVEAKLKEQKMKVNVPVTDEVFLRRIYLDVAGRVPTIEEAEAFHRDDYAGKREKLVEQLLHSEAYVSRFYNFWADILRINTNLGNSGAQAEAAYQLWVKQSLRENMSYRDFVYELVRARGHIWENGAAGYYQRDRGMPLDNMSNTVRTFLGIRLECAQCHNHPFDKWTQMDYFKMAAFSYGMNANAYGGDNRNLMGAKLREQRMEKYRETVAMSGLPIFSREADIDSYIKRSKERKQWDQMLAKWEISEKEFREKSMEGLAAARSVEDSYKGVRQVEQIVYQRVRYTTTSEAKREVKLPHDYQYDDAKPLSAVGADTMFGYDIEPDEVDGSLIDAYAAWMTSPENPTFTRVAANRLWKQVFGAGVFEPLDEITDHTYVSNPELMVYLEQLLKELDYDMKAYLKVLFNTRTYQREANRSEIMLGAPYYFPGPALRRMSAEQIWDSIVGLALPEADNYRPRLKGQVTSVENLKLTYESLVERSPEDYVAMVTEIVEAVSDSLEKTDEVRAQIVVARQEEKEEESRTLRQELNRLQREVDRKISEIAFTKLNQRAEASNLLAALGMSEMSMSAMAEMSDGMSNEKGLVLTALPAPKLPEPPAELDRDERKRWQDKQRADLRNYQSLVAQMARASELPSPAPRGHFLREFGQSDREVIENASQHASVPQALNLLNGPIVDALVNPLAVFGTRLRAAEGSQEKVEIIFQGMLTRKPTPAEKELAMAQVEEYGDKAYDALVWSLLNTQQFLFIQ